MGKIHVLSEQVANRIAAGEVVVRPSAVVKELVENAVDAGAKKIRIDIQKAGKDSILIIDDGCGMDKDDAKMCFVRHATSKIRSDEDLFKLNSYGFRGEALPSIASVAMIELTTCMSGQAQGIKLQLEAGEIRLEQPSPPVPGTTIHVRNLFYNTPARRKFLKNDVTELNHIMDTVIDQGLISLSVGFELRSDGKTILSLPEANDLKERIKDIYGQSLLKSLFYVEDHNPLIRVHGYISRPQLHRANRTLQKVFVNKRPVRDKAVSYAIQAAYANILPGGRHPVALLFLDVPEGYVDVNVHPAKDEVKFRDEASVRHIVQHLIKQGIDQMAQKEELSEESAQPIVRLEPPKVFGFSESISKPTPAKESSSPVAQPSVLKEATPEISYANMRESAAYSFYGAEESVPKVTPEPAVIVTQEEPEEHILDRMVLTEQIRQPKRFYKVKDLFIVTEDEQGLVIIDQHAAQERVMYEKFLNYIQNHQKPAQDLLVPIAFDVSVAEKPTLMALMEPLSKLGFVIEEFGPETFHLRSVPTFVKEKEAVPTIRDLLDHAKELGFEKGSLMNRFDEVLERMACRASIKAGDKVSDDELSYIFQDLQECQDPHTCPHGRPTMIKLDFDELERKFRRKKQ